MGIITAKLVCAYYFNDIITLFFGGLTVAVALEEVNLHKRIALRVLKTVGAEPKWLLFGFMSITSFLSCWISNVAATAMILPIGIAVLDQLKKNIDENADEHTKSENVPLVKVEIGKRGSQTSESASSGISEELQERYKSHNEFCKAIVIAVCYTASIGGTGMLTGTGANLIFMGILPSRAGINFGSFALMNFPIAVIMTFICWAWLWFLYIRKSKKSTPAQLEIVTGIIDEEYKSLGKMSWAEKTVATIFSLLAFLWLTRKPGFMPGWADIPIFSTVNESGRAYISDSTVSIFMAFWLFVLPKEKPSFGQPPPKPILTFKMATTRLPWGVIFILGGGFAMAAGVNSSGLADWIGTKLDFLVGMPIFIVVVICASVVCFTSQAASNSATITIFLPVLQSLASTLH